jgi:hypothetical protein
MSRYFNDDAYPLVQNDTWPIYTFQIGANGQAADFTGYPNVVVKAKVRERGAVVTLAEITCDTVDRSSGQFKVSAWPAAVMSSDPTTLEMQVEVDYLGDGTYVATVYHLVKFKLYEEFADAS